MLKVSRIALPSVVDEPGYKFNDGQVALRKLNRDKWLYYTLCQLVNEVTSWDGETEHPWMLAGICNWMREASDKTRKEQQLTYAAMQFASPTLSKLITTWPEHSGDTLFPVPDPAGASPEEAYYRRVPNHVDAVHYLWRSEYGQARMRLLYYLIRQLEYRIFDKPPVWNLQDIFNCAIYTGVYDRSREHLVSEHMCEALTICNYMSMLSIRNCRKATDAISKYLISSTYQHWRLLSSVLRVTNRPSDFDARLAIYSNWAKRPRLNKPR